MSRGAKYAVVGAAVALVLLWQLPTWLAVLIILGMLAIPMVAYLLLDPSQRRRLRNTRRRQLGP